MKFPSGMNQEQKQQFFLKAMHMALQRRKREATPNFDKPEQESSPAPASDPSSQSKRRTRRKEASAPKKSMVQFVTRANRNSVNRRSGRRGARSLLRG